MYLCIIWVNIGKMVGREDLRMVFLEFFFNCLRLLFFFWFWDIRFNFCFGFYFGIVDMVGVTILSKLVEGFKLGGIGEVRVDSV